MNHAIDHEMPQVSLIYFLFWKFFFVEPSFRYIFFIPKNLELSTFLEIFPNKNSRPSGPKVQGLCRRLGYQNDEAFGPFPGRKPHFFRGFSVGVFGCFVGRGWFCFFFLGGFCCVVVVFFLCVETFLRSFSLVCFCCLAVFFWRRNLFFLVVLFLAPHFNLIVFPLKLANNTLFFFLLLCEIHQRFHPWHFC